MFQHSGFRYFIRLRGCFAGVGFGVNGRGCSSEDSGLRSGFGAKAWTLGAISLLFDCTNGLGVYLEDHGM